MEQLQGASFEEMKVSVHVLSLSIPLISCEEDIFEVSWRDLWARCYLSIKLQKWTSRLGGSMSAL